MDGTLALALPKRCSDGGVPASHHHRRNLLPRFRCLRMPRVVSLPGHPGEVFPSVHASHAKFHRPYACVRTVHRDTPGVPRSLHPRVLCTHILRWSHLTTAQRSQEEEGVPTVSMHSLAVHLSVRPGRRRRSLRS